MSLKSIAKSTFGGAFFYIIKMSKKYLFEYELFERDIRILIQKLQFLGDSEKAVMKNRNSYESLKKTGSCDLSQNVLYILVLSLLSATVSAVSVEETRSNND